MYSQNHHFPGAFRAPSTFDRNGSGQCSPKRRCILLNLRQGRAWRDETLANQRGRIPQWVAGQRCHRAVKEYARGCKKQESFKNPSTTFNLVASIFVHVTVLHVFCFSLRLLKFDKSTPTVLSWISQKTILEHRVNVPYQPKWPNGRLAQDLVTIVFRPLVAGRQNLRKTHTTRGEDPF